MVKGLKSHITGAIWDVDLAALPAWTGAPGPRGRNRARSPPAGIGLERRAR